VVNELTANRPPLVQRLLQRVQHEAGVRRTAHPPADDAPGKHVRLLSGSRVLIWVVIWVVPLAGIWCDG